MILVLINRNVVIFKEVYKEVSKTNLKVIHTDIDNVHTILDEIYCAKGKPRQIVTTSNNKFNDELRNKFITMIKILFAISYFPIILQL